NEQYNLWYVSRFQRSFHNHGAQIACNHLRSKKRKKDVLEHKAAHRGRPLCAAVPLRGAPGRPRGRAEKYPAPGRCSKFRDKCVVE
ncbi:hypothetical protein, partial [Ruthenibacterium lactatiformans]|uniref:hypothetical protein n=1 Tax=Ruthenibacterium lactatiformans TaxID=1550024 RepID=UPI00210E078D